jgi:serpin B
VPPDSMASTDAGRRHAAAADDMFGADLFRLLGAAGQNTVFSPASVAAALQMALCGARGATAAQLAAALHLDGPDRAADGLRLLSDLLSSAGAAGAAGSAGSAGAAGAGGSARAGGPGGGMTLRAPNSLWVQAGLPLSPGFTGQLAGIAGVTVRPADFRSASAEARAQINDLIAEQTAGKITNLLGPDAVSAATRLVLANAVYLKAAWTFPFPARATAGLPFHPGDDGSAPLTVPTMRLTADLAYLRADGYRAVLLPYKESRLAMAVVLPDAGPPAALAPRLAHGLAPLLRGATRQSVALSLPKFRQRAGFGLIPVLQQLGVQDAFTSAANFSGVTSAERLFIGAVVHQAYIDVDEQGTEAAAATAVAMRPMALRRGPEPIRMIVDRPFLFAITDTATGLPLFLGQVGRPAA